MRISLMSNRKRPELSHPRGSVLVEAALSIGLVFVPMALGVTVVGMNLIRIVQVNQINRDAGHMFARGVDFTGDANGLVTRGIVFQMAAPLKTSTGTGVLILSLVEYVNSTTTCPSPCNNSGHVVFIQQIVIGNSNLRASSFGTVAAGSKDATSGKVNNPTTDTTVRADGVRTYLTMTDGDMAYVSETYYSSADLAIPGFPSPVGTYARAFF
jgi:hypothetical protein